MEAGQRSKIRLESLRGGFFPEDQGFDQRPLGLNTGVAGPYEGGLPAINVEVFALVLLTESTKRVDANWHFIDNYS